MTSRAANEWIVKRDRLFCIILMVWLCLIRVSVALALELSLPTANKALLKPGHDAEFFQPTVEGTVETGLFGYNRRGGQRFHEGIDIKCLHRDKRGEPLDSVHAVADGTVALANPKPGLSNYGRYVVLEHRWDGVLVHTLYAHLSAIDGSIIAGQPVHKGQVLGTLGHSSNTHEGIPAERAHLHFEVNLLLNTNFHIWYPKRDPKAPPFGNFNGKNLFGMDPAALFRASAANPKLNFAEWVAKQPVALTILVSARPFPWLSLHPEQIQPVADKNAGILAYEIGVASWGLPIAVWPRTATELTDVQRRLLARRTPVIGRINETALDHASSRSLVARAKHGWQFTESGREWVEMLTYAP